MDTTTNEVDMRPMIQIGEEAREMTETEYSEWLQHGAEVEARRQEELRKLEASEDAREKLRALGLTEQEIAALVG